MAELFASPFLLAPNRMSCQAAREGMHEARAGAACPQMLASRRRLVPSGEKAGGGTRGHAGGVQVLARLHGDGPARTEWHVCHMRQCAT